MTWALQPLLAPLRPFASKIAVWVGAGLPASAISLLSPLEAKERGELAGIDATTAQHDLPTHLPAREPSLASGARQYDGLAPLPAGTNPALSPGVASHGFHECVIAEASAPAERHVGREESAPGQHDARGASADPSLGRMPCPQGGQGQSGEAGKRSEGREAANGC